MIDSIIYTDIRRNICGICKETQDDMLSNTLPICKKCLEAWRELILEKRGIKI